LYDPLDPDRSDLDPYATLAAEFGARTVLDIGCGTGTFACLLAGRGLEVIAADPAAASLEVARRKPGAGRVRWVHTDATALPPVQVDLVTMTGNVAQVFVTGEEWAAVLRAVHAGLRPGGRLAFESRDPKRKAWLGWNRGQTDRRAVIPGAGPVQTWVDLTKVEGNLVSFRTTFVFDRDGAVLTSDSTLRFRSRGELADSLTEAGLVVDEVRDAPDRPGLEFVFIARKAA
jgi:SAM-dependent methyltransferase